MRLRYMIAVPLVAAIALPLAGRSARGDVRLNSAVQTALDLGQVIGAATACPDIAPARIKGLTNRFTAALKEFAANKDDTATVGGAFEQGVIFGGQSIGVRQTRCDAASRDLAGWEANTVPLMPAAPVLAAPVLAAPLLAAPPPSPVAVAPVVSSTGPAIPGPAIPGLANQGVTAQEIRFGMAAPFSGPAKELGRQMRLGIDTAFNSANDAGGVAGRKLRLITADDGYEPGRTGEAMKQLYEKDLVFGFVGNVGTPTTVVALPYAMSRRALFFGAFTGAPLLRSDPPDRYVFNYRASYAEETYATVHYLVKIRHLKPEQIAVFAQQDGYGDAGFEGVAAAMRSLSPNGDSGAIPRFAYQRNTDDVEAAIIQLQQYQRLHNTAQIKAVVMVATAKAAVKFIDRSRDRVPGLVYTNVSFVGSTALAKELLALGPKVAAGVIVTQVVPPVDSYSSVVLNYKAALEKYFPGEAPDYVSFEGYLDANVLIEGLRRTGAQLDTEKLVTALEAMKDFDLGVGAKIGFSSGDHQALHRIWGTQLDETGHYKPILLE